MARIPGASILARRPVRLGLAVLAAGLALTLLATLRTDEAVRHEQAHRFQTSAERLEGSVGRRILRAEQILRSARAAHVAMGGFDRRRFRTYVERLERDGEMPSVRGLGVVARVPRTELPAFVARERADAAPGFNVHGTGNAPDLFVTRFAEPMGRNAAGWGRDWGNEPLRRAAAEQAVDTGGIALSAPLVQLQADRGPGWILFLPIYRPGAPTATVAGRREALEGLLYARMLASEVLSTVRGVQEDGLQFQLWDGAPAAGRPVYDSRTAQPSTTAPPEHQPVYQGELSIGGRQLTIRVWSEDGPPLGTVGATVGVAFTGIALSVLLALAVGRLLAARESAEERSRRMQEELARMEELAQRTTGVVVGLDERLRLRWINAGFTLLSGWTEDDCVGHPASRFLRAADGGAELAEAVDRLRHGASHLRIELLHGRKDGSLCWLDATVQLDGEDGGFLLTADDISARRLAERRLAESEHLIRLMADNIPARLSYWDADLRCRMANRTLLQQYGRTLAQLRGTPMQEVLGAEVFAEVGPRLEAALRGVPQRFERTHARAGGQPMTTLVHYVPDYDHGEVCGLFVLSLDITELKQAQEAALEASRAKTQFLSHMSHEIRTPMNAILGMLALLRSTELDARQADYSHKAEAAARSLLGLLNDVLDLTKIESGKMQLDPAPFRVDSLLQDLAAILGGTAHAKSLRLTFDADPAIPPVLVGDDMRLRQVLVNLGGNAVKFTHRGEVVVGLRLVERSAQAVLVEFAVRDTGIGIAPQDQERIFTDFSQAAASTTREFGGTGLGLGICRRLVAMMGGELRLESLPGRGSCFFFTLRLPVADAGAQTQPPRIGAPGQVEAGRRLAGLRLLVVEDNAINQQVARELLCAHGADVTLAGDGREGVRAVETAPLPFDAVLMDVQMPVMDGYTATREIRERLGDRRTPIIAMTANAMAPDRERCLQAGMDDHVPKPFDLPMLLDVLARHAVRRIGGPTGGPPPAPSTPPASADPAYWNRAGALQRLGGNAALLDSMVPLFCRNLRETEQQLQALAAGVPTEQAVALFHTLKGMAATMGAEELARAAGIAERGLRDGGPAPAAELAAPVRQAIEATLAVLDPGA
ncbi:MAG TPA: CHASE domain-containing protein [Ramlibacter sp.]|jgi:PAS domain S-box-containing protein|uniref:CHASE domain-containing protein n=1 Tax=Ramlibacter sp. TaxID=1917967 RepID=UPI002D28E756|nr:CHASE domain-containing protein [Ramlibacter sp.]HZY19153.1 CHASE domain-containing protein [Ramlibacter sp.]